MSYFIFFFSGDHRKPTVHDYDEVLLQNYTLYKRNNGQVGEGFVDQFLVNKTSVTVYAHLFGSDEEIYKIFATQCQNSSEKMFISGTSENLYNYNEATQQVCPWHIIKYPRENCAAFGSYPPNHFFFEMLNDVVDTFILTGIIDHIVRKNCEIRNYIKKKIGDPESMTLNYLGFGFIIWICTLCPTILIFLVELHGWIYKILENKNVYQHKFAKIHSKISVVNNRDIIIPKEIDSAVG